MDNNWFIMGTVADAIAAVRAGQRVQVELQPIEVEAFKTGSSWVDVLLLSMTPFGTSKAVDPSIVDYLRWSSAKGMSCPLFLTVQQLTEPAFRIFPMLKSIEKPPIYKARKGGKLGG
jgi:hypothetical protein